MISQNRAIYYKYKNKEDDVRNRLISLFDLNYHYERSKYKTTGNYLRYLGYQSMADRIIYTEECGTRNTFINMMTEIREISFDLYIELSFIFSRNYSTAMKFKKVKIALYNATHLTKG